MNRNRGQWVVAVGAILYVSIVLLLDFLIIRGGQWPFLQALYVNFAGFEFYKCVAWLVIPFLISLPWLDRGWFGIKRWRRSDWLLLSVLALACLGAVLIIPLFPSLRHIYSGLGGASAAHKRRFLAHNLLWLASWLPGWEFLHRYFLLRPVMEVMPRYGWLLVPLSEGLYHLQKPPLEMAGMVVFSIVLTYWAMRRRNMLLPLLAHLAIELELLVFLLIV